MFACAGVGFSSGRAAAVVGRGPLTDMGFGPAAAMSFVPSFVQNFELSAYVVPQVGQRFI
jgi:hypothetical protein